MIDFTFRRECEQFVFAMLGADSDNACAYFACGECGSRWGEMLPARQAELKFCTRCHQPCTPVPVEPMRPEHWIDGKPANYVDPLAPPRSEDDEGNELDEVAEYGRQVHEAATRIKHRRRAKALGRTHIAKAIGMVQKKLLSQGITRTADELREMRRKYSDRVSSLERYRNKKREAMK